MAKKTKTPKFDLEAQGLDAAVIKQVREHLSAIDAIGRKDIDQSLQVGQHLAEVEAILGDEKLFKPWVKEDCQISVKHASNLKGIFLRFGERREELMTHQVRPTVLFSLLPASEETVERVLGSFAAGERLKVREVKEIVKAAASEAEAETLEPLDIGGSKGLKGLASLIVATEVANVVGLAKGMIGAIEAALEEAGEKRLLKEKLSRDLEPRARSIRPRLIRLLQPLPIDEEYVGSMMDPAYEELPDGRWADVQAIIVRLQSHRAWPGNQKLKVWLNDEVLPALRFMVKGDPFGEPKATMRAQADAEAVSDDAEVDVPVAVETPEDAERVVAQPETVTDAPSLAVEPEEPVEVEPQAKRAGPVLVEAEAEVGPKPKTSRPSPRRKAKLEVVENVAPQPSI